MSEIIEITGMTDVHEKKYSHCFIIDSRKESYISSLVTGVNKKQGYYSHNPVNGITSISSLYVCMVNTIYLFSFVETPRKFIIAKLSIEKKRRYELTDRKFCNNKFQWCFHKAKLVSHLF